MEILYSLAYALLNGFLNVSKKMSTKKNSHPVAILAIFSTLAFLLSLSLIPFGVSIPLEFVWIFAVKGFIISLSFYILIIVLKSVEITLVTATNILSTVLTFIIAITIFGENASVLKIVGCVLIVIGVSLINLLGKEKTKNKKSNLVTILLLLLVAIILASSSAIDKYTTTYLTNFQVQFWFLLFSCIFSWLFFAFECMRTKQFLIKKSDFKNYWIYLLSIFLFVGDFMLFMAYMVPSSQMIVITILSKLNIIVTTIAGIIIFKEQHVLLKILYILIILTGAIMVSVFW